MNPLVGESHKNHDAFVETTQPCQHQKILIEPSNKSKILISLTWCKIPWLIPNLEKTNFFPLAFLWRWQPNVTFVGYFRCTLAKSQQSPPILLQLYCLNRAKTQLYHKEIKDTTKCSLPRILLRKTQTVVLCHTILWGLLSFLETCRKFGEYQQPANRKKHKKS